MIFLNLEIAVNIRYIRLHSLVVFSFLNKYRNASNLPSLGGTGHFPQKSHRSWDIDGGYSARQPKISVPTPQVSRVHKFPAASTFADCSACQDVRWGWWHWLLLVSHCEKNRNFTKGLAPGYDSLGCLPSSLLIARRRRPIPARWFGRRMLTSSEQTFSVWFQHCASPTHLPQIIPHTKLCRLNLSCEKPEVR